ncbi:hypothetical protein ABAC460_10480 [Asticcacaulis sp. AC460]|uniref:hypothetical protein n=1 Tax=Asticcacaulis sp. AC460 TaxID=1282360 RepID=UPI0003C40965|nr:hypothetical protein [Asticcacaulis sp. AC460]ESQ90168.1 hypothetical protein ABAC460_10480 [Asticcacaulis sp. AC460]
MTFYYIEPEVAGGWGENTVFERTPAVGTTVHKLHYVFEDWFGDSIVTSSHCYIVTEAASIEILNDELTGVIFDDVEVSTYPQFSMLRPGVQLPKFVWMKVVGQQGKDDFGRNRGEDLVISERALNIFKKFGLTVGEFRPLG